MSGTDYNNVKASKKKQVEKSTEVVKEERKAKQPLVKNGSVKARKRTVIERLVTGLVGPHGAKSIVHYIFKEKIVPLMLDGMASAGKTAIDMMRYGEDMEPSIRQNNQSNFTRNSSNRQGAHPKNYQQAYNGQQARSNNIVTRKNTIYDYTRVTFMDRDEAMMILDTMVNNVDQYGNVSIADYYDWIDRDEETTFADVNYGWTDLRSARVVAVRGGFDISLPPVEVIDQ